MAWRKTVISQFNISSQEDHNWYQGRRSDGKFGRIPSGHVKERGEATLEGSIAPQAPRKGDTRRMDVPDQGEPPTPKSPKRAECALYENTKFLYPTVSRLGLYNSVGLTRGPFY